MRSGFFRKRCRASAALVLVIGLSACGFNTVVESDEDVKAAWANVENQYKRRADLVPQLVSTVKGAANFEQETLTRVVEARSQVGKLKIDSGTIEDPQRMKQFEAAQGQLTGALSRLMVVMEKYPELKATTQFRDLQVSLEGTENRIGVARTRFIESVANYNKVVQVFPSMIGARIRGKTIRPTFEGVQGAEQAPEIKF